MKSEEETLDAIAPSLKSDSVFGFAAPDTSALIEVSFLFSSRVIVG